jgi:CubicO group peptidase (beta-lactamase class C family)
MKKAEPLRHIAVTVRRTSGILKVQTIPMISRLTFASLLIVLYSCTQQPKSVLQPGADLAVGQSTDTLNLTRHDADTFHIGLEKNGFIYGNAHQIDVDVIVRIIDPAGKNIATFDNPARGPENFDFQSDTTGVYKIVVSPFQENAGDYILTIKGAEPIATDIDKRIEQFVVASIGSLEGPGASVAVEKDGKVIYAAGLGHANLEYDIHNSSTTVFHIASISKQFTAFAIAMLADHGKLSIHDDIRKYLPEMHDFGTPITINHLIHHTSGLRDQWNLLMLAGWRLDDVITRQQIMRLVTKQRELNFKPGDEMVYCNTGYMLMAEIVSRVTGESFPAWMEKNVFLPLDMKNTLVYDDHERIVPNRAYSYHVGSRGFDKSVLSYANAGATSLFTTVEDLSKWAANFEDVKVGNNKVMDMMEERFILNNGDTISYAFGQVIGEYRGLKMISHGGADAGYRTFLARFPDQKTSVTVFSNLASFNPGGLAFKVADYFLADEFKPEPKKTKPTPAEPDAPEQKFDGSSVKLSDFTGRFYSPELETTYSMVIVNDTLIAKHQRHDDTKMIPGKTDGFSNNSLGDVVFTRDKNKRVTGFKVSNGRVRNLLFEKID